MASGTFLLLWFAGALFLLFIISGLFFYLWRQKRQEVKRSLNLLLMTVKLPVAEAKEEEKALERVREKISVMEQFYASLASLKGGGWFSPKPWLAFELTVPAKDLELSFYVAVPRRLADTAEKLIHAYYPEASVEHAPDYNIFIPRAQAVMSHAELTEKDQYLPIKTYRALESDPLKAITSVFTKLDEATEGAALQIVFRPAAKKMRKLLLARAEAIYKGKKSGKTTGGILKELAFGDKKAEANPTPEPQRTPIDEAKAKSLEDKATRPLFEANLRLIASAPTEERSLVILQALEQPFAVLADPYFAGVRFLREKPKRLRKEIFKFSFRLFDEKQKMILSAAELTSMYHFPNTAIEVPGIESLKSRESAPPPDLPRQGLLLGYNLFRGVETEIRMTREDRRRHLYIIGQTGTGKSNFLKSLIAQDIQKGEGVCIIDPHGELPEYALGFVPESRIDDVIYFDPGDLARPLGLNMLEYDPKYPEQKTLLINELLAIFNKLFNMEMAGGPAFEQYFRNAAQLVMDDPETGNTLLEIQRIFADKEFRDLKLSRTSNVLVRSFWTEIAEKTSGEQSLQNFGPYITNKFDVFLSSDILRPIIAQEKSSFNFREVMDQRKILLVSTAKGKLGELSSNLLGLIVVGKLLLAAFSRGDVPEDRRSDFYLYIDEFQNVTTKSIATILSEARKFRLAMTITHQFIGQLEEDIKKAVFGNVGSMMAFRIGNEDGEFVEPQFAPDFAARDLVSLDNFRAYVKLLIEGKTAKPFSMRTYPAPKQDLSRARRIKEISQLRYGRPRTEIEAEITRKRLRGKEEL